MCTWRWESTLTTRAFVGASESVVGSRPWWLLWSPQLCMCLQTAPATTLPLASGSLQLRRCTPLDLGHRGWLTWSPPAGPGGATDILNSPMQSLWNTYGACQGPHGCQCYRPSGLRPRDIMPAHNPARPSTATQPTTWCPTALDPGVKSQKFPDKKNQSNCLKDIQKATTVHR